MSPFDRECQQIAAQLEQINPEGVNPLVERKLGRCPDCGRVTRNEYLCTMCAAELRREREKSG